VRIELVDGHARTVLVVLAEVGQRPGQRIGKTNPDHQRIGTYGAGRKLGCDDKGKDRGNAHV
jgi:hypothetical protein